MRCCIGRLALFIASLPRFCITVGSLRLKCEGWRFAILLWILLVKRPAQPPNTPLALNQESDRLGICHMHAACIFREPFLRFRIKVSGNLLSLASVTHRTPVSQVDSNFIDRRRNIWENLALQSSLCGMCTVRIYIAGVRFPIGAEFANNSLRSANQIGETN